MTKTIDHEKKVKKPYWKTLLQGFKFWPRLWLENFEIPPQKNNKEFLHDPTISISRLNEFAHINKLTPSSVIFAAWGLLLHRYSGLNDVVFWVTTKKNTVVVRTTVNDKQTLLHYIKDFQQQLQVSQNYAETLAKEISSKKQHKIFYFAHEDDDMTDIPFDRNHHRHLGIIFTVTEIKFHYHPDIFSEESIVNIDAHYKQIISAIIQTPQDLTTHFSILISDEKNNLLKTWNQPKSPIKQNACTHELFSHVAQNNPQRTAIGYENKIITYQQLDALSNQLANLLLQETVEPGEMVAVLMDRTPEIIIAMLAIFKIGAIYVPINPKFPDHRIHSILNDCRAKVILANNNKRIPEELIFKSVFFENEARLKLFSRDKITIKVDPEQIAYIVYTTGITDRSKGVMIKHISLVNLSCYYQHCFALNPEDRSSQFSSQAFDTFFCETIPFLTTGSSIHIIDDHMKLNSNLFIPWLAEQEITICDLPTAYAQILMNETWPADMALRILKVGGDPLTRLPGKQLHFDIWNSYGPTEATIETTLAKVYNGYRTQAEPWVTAHNPPPIGKPIANAEVYVVDSNLQPVPIGIAGEMLIGGLGLSAGYLNREHLTQEVFIQNPFNDDPSARVFKTGDLVRWLDDGNLQFIERIENQIKLEGFRIELTKIESALSQFPEISEVIVISRDAPGKRKQLVACLVPNLNKIRIPFQEPALLEIDSTKLYEVITEDLSKEGVALCGLLEKIELGKPLRLHLKLPGMTTRLWLTGMAIWQSNLRIGIKFYATLKQQEALANSVKYYLSTHNLMHILQDIATKRNFRHALKNKLPAHMIPEVISMIPKIHLTFSGKIDWRVLPTHEFEKYFKKTHIEALTTTEKKLADMWRDIFQVDAISLTDSFFQLGAGSLQLAQFVLNIEKVFQIRVPLNVLLDLPYIAIIAEYIDSKGEKYTRQSSIQYTIRRDILLPEDIIPPKKISENVTNILLTGSDSFLGAHILKELLIKTNKKIYCVLKAEKNKPPFASLLENLEKYKIDITLDPERVIAIAGDLGFHKLGISSEKYDELAEKIGRIYHFGADVNHLTAYDNMRNSNVLGTLEIIKFATHKTKKSIFTISTFLAVSTTDTMGNYIEDFLTDNEPFNLIGGYALSKWVSERLLTQIMYRGLPVIIFRLGCISGQSETGMSHTDDAFLYLIKGCIQLGYAPNWDKKITLLPVDFASLAMTAISEAYPDKSIVLHLDHPQGIMWTDLIIWLNEYGYAIKLCEPYEWIKRLSSVTPNNALYRFIPLYLQDQSIITTPYANMSAASRMLDHLKIEYPRIDKALLQRYCDYLCSIACLPHPKKK